MLSEASASPSSRPALSPSAEVLSNAIKCMRVYQDLNQFFSIDTKEISYDGVLQEFMDGKIVYTVATSESCCASICVRAQSSR